MLDRRKRVDRVDQPSVGGLKGRFLAVAAGWKCDVDRQQMIAAESTIDVDQPNEARTEQSGDHEQHDRKGDLQRQQYCSRAEATPIRGRRGAAET